ncbi:MAG: histidinol dehydrogenase [Armatimonadetes bacterium]|nr:histidinol dehydrogenase [Armatimonadota bacterium]
MRLLRSREYTREDLLRLLQPRTAADLAEPERIVREMCRAVRERGDAALLEYVGRFDSPLVKDPADIPVRPEEFAAAEREVSDAYRAAVAAAIGNIERYHRKQLRPSWVDTEGGVLLGQIVRPIERVGLYIPGAQAPLASTLLMTAVPARVAGVPFLALCTPPRRDGTVNPHVLYAARACGVARVYKAGGAPAIAALAYGTATVPRVDKIVGPGPIWVVLAKREVFGDVGIESLPGPSEIAILADDTARPEYVAADLLSQAEHGGDNLSVLVTPSEALAQAVLTAVRRQTDASPRAAVIRRSLEFGGAVVVVTSLAEGLEIVNALAPEHLELAVAESLALLGKVKAAGAILLGEASPEPVGDYMAGPSHVLPTGGTARFSSPLGVDDFQVRSSVIAYTLERLRDEAAHILALAEVEGLDAHANAVRVRMS